MVIVVIAVVAWVLASVLIARTTGAAIAQADRAEPARRAEVLTLPIGATVAAPEPALSLRESA